MHIIFHKYYSIFPKYLQFYLRSHYLMSFPFSFIIFFYYYYDLTTDIHA